MRAVLEATTSGAPAGVRLWAVQTPLRPPVLAVAPAEFSSRAYRVEHVTLPITVGQAGRQRPFAWRGEC